MCRHYLSTFICTQTPDDPTAIEAERAADWKKCNAEFKALAGTEVDVRGDGLCWLYAVLASMNVLENPGSLTERDRVVLQKFVHLLKQFVDDGGVKKLTVKEKKLVKDLRDTPPKTLDTESYGGGTLFFRVIAAFLKTSILAVQDGYIGETMFFKSNGKLVAPLTVTGGFVEYASQGQAGR